MRYAAAVMAAMVCGANAVEAQPAMWQGYYRDNARTIVLAAADRTLRPPTCAALRAIPVPILLIAGERTPPAIRATNDGLMDCLRPDAERARVPDAGHYWYADNAAEGARLLVAFLRRHRGQ